MGAEAARGNIAAQIVDAEWGRHALPPGAHRTHGRREEGALGAGRVLDAAIVGGDGR